MIASLLATLCRRCDGSALLALAKNCPMPAATMPARRVYPCPRGSSAIPPAPAAAALTVPSRALWPGCFHPSAQQARLGIALLLSCACTHQSIMASTSSASSIAGPSRAATLTPPPVAAAAAAPAALPPAARLSTPGECRLHRLHAPSPPLSLPVVGAAARCA